MGTVIHDTLRRLYEPVKGREITVEAIGEMLKISDTVAKEVFDAANERTKPDYGA